MKKKIFICGISTECCSYSTLIQNKKDFEVLSGKKLLKYINFPYSKHNNITFIPNKFYRSLPGGPVDKKFFIKTISNITNDLIKSKSIDGILLIMHGAMYVKGISDPEGFFIKKIRSKVSKNCKISLSYDLHGQMTDSIIKNINYFAAYKTAPHIDVKQTYSRALKMLIDGILKNKKNHIIWEKIPVLVSGEMSSTIVEPCKKIYKNLNIFNKLNGINDCNLLIGYVWADTKRATASAIVNCTDVNIGKRICKKIALSYWNNRFNLVYDMKSYKLNKIFHVVNKKRFTILADSGDNPTAGGVGNRIDVLEYVFKNKIENTLFAGIYNEEIFRDLKNKKNKIVIKDSISKKKISISIDKFYLKNDNAIVISNNNTVIFTKYRKPFHYLSDFKELNINLKKYKILIVKSGYLSPELKKLKADNFMILTDGFVTQDFKRIKNLFREKPIYPFQKNFRYNIAI